MAGFEEGEKAKRKKGVKAEVISVDSSDLRDTVVQSFASKVLSGQTLQEAADNCGANLSLFVANRMSEPLLRQVFKVAEERENAPRDMSNVAAGMFQGPLEIKAQLAFHLLKEGFFEKFLEYFRRIDPDADDFDKKMDMLIRNRFLDQILPRTSMSQDTTEVRSSSNDTRSVEDLEKVLTSRLEQWHEEKQQREEAAENRRMLAARLAEENEAGQK